MKYALIGCGRISPNHIEAAKNNKLDFVAMCDILPEAMKEKSDKFGLESVRKYIDYKELLEKEKPELVPTLLKLLKKDPQEAHPAG